MKIEVGFAGLDRILEKMGIEELSKGPNGDGWDPIDIELAGRGIDVEIEDIVVDPDNGTFSYNDRRVLVYIRDQYISYGSYKFHVANCSTIQDMKKKKRFESRYVASTRTDGKFVVNLIENHGEIAEVEQLIEMSICKNCLKHLNYKNYNYNSYSDREEIYSEFSLEEFFEIYGETTVSKPKKTDITAPINEYSPHWETISRIYRERVEWKCEEKKCRIYLGDKEAQKFLHTHHINGDKSDNSRVNLCALCVDCHNAQPLHRLPEKDIREFRNWKRRHELD